MFGAGCLMFGAGCLMFGAGCLMFAIWNLFEIWRLGFGIYLQLVIYEN